MEGEGPQNWIPVLSSDGDHKPDWSRILRLALAKNPKVPLGVVLPLINRLTLRDLKSLKDDKGVAEAVRVNARKFYQAKQK